jgi:hypothetical protein
VGDCVGGGAWVGCEVGVEGMGDVGIGACWRWANAGGGALLELMGWCLIWGLEMYLGGARVGGGTHMGCGVGIVNWVNAGDGLMMDVGCCWS